MLLERMVNLLSRGCVVPVLKYIKTLWQRGDTDISLIRYFVTEVFIKDILMRILCFENQYFLIFQANYEFNLPKGHILVLLF